TTSIRAYLYTAVRNRALNVTDHENVIAAFEADESAAEFVATTPRQPEELRDDAELHSRLAAAFESLPEKQASAMRLRWRDELSHAEIARVLGISVKGVE